MRSILAHSHLSSPELLNIIFLILNPNIMKNIKYTSFFFFFILLIITTFFIQRAHSLPEQPQHVPDYSVCMKQSYNCGKLSGISYPFWGLNRPSYCGAADLFQLHCHNNQDTTILISSQNFTVIEINTETYFIKLKRTDLSLNLCSPQFDETYLSPNLFQYLPQVKNITIYYNCSYPQSFSKDSLCGSQNLAAAYVSDEFFEESTDCKKHIHVPTEADFHIDEPYESGYIDRDDLETGLNNGFEVSYNVVSRECLACLGNQKGKCSWKNDTHIEKHAKSSCYYGICPDGSFDYFSNCSLHKSKQNLTRKLVIGVGSAVFVAFAVIIAIYFYKRKSYVQSRSLSSELTSKDLESGSQHLSFGVNTYHFSYSELEEATNNFDPSKVLGKGAFGTVYYGTLNDGRSVAVKKLLEKNNDKRVEQFKNEVEIMASLVHENLVSLYGCTSLHSPELLLVYEYVSNGTVADHLRGKEAKHGKLTWPIRMNIAVETAKALEYLHTSKIIHRDIKTNNILLDNHFRVKVADFGLSRLFQVDKTHVSTAPRGTLGYLDPEYQQRSQLSVKSDVYSFGVVMIELISSLRAVDNITSDGHEFDLACMALTKIQNKALHEIVDPTLGFESDSKVKNMIIAMGDLASQCLQSSKNSRPTMNEVLESLEEIQNDKLKSQPEVMGISSLSDEASTSTIT